MHEKTTPDQREVAPAPSDLVTVVTDICRHNHAALFVTCRGPPTGSASSAKSLLDPHCDKCYLLLSSCINVSCRGLEGKK